MESESAREAQGWHEAELYAEGNSEAMEDFMTGWRTADRTREVTEIVTEVMVLPDGMDSSDWECRTWALAVRWRGSRTETGRGGYAIIHHGNHMSHKGKWRYEPEPFLQRHYRWEDLDSALTAARAVVNDVKVMGRTYAEWKAGA